MPPNSRIAWKRRGSCTDSHLPVYLSLEEQKIPQPARIKPRRGSMCMTASPDKNLLSLPFPVPAAILEKGNQYRTAHSSQKNAGAVPQSSKSVPSLKIKAVSRRASVSLEEKATPKLTRIKPEIPALAGELTTFVSHKLTALAKTKTAAAREMASPRPQNLTPRTRTPRNNTPKTGTSRGQTLRGQTPRGTKRERDAQQLPQLRVANECTDADHCRSSRIEGTGNSHSKAHWKTIQTRRSSITKQGTSDWKDSMRNKMKQNAAASEASAAVPWLVGVPRGRHHTYRQAALTIAGLTKIWRAREKARETRIVRKNLREIAYQSTVICYIYIQSQA